MHESATALAGDAATRLMRGRPDDVLLQLATEEQATLVAVDRWLLGVATGNHGFLMAKLG